MKYHFTVIGSCNRDSWMDCDTLGDYWSPENNSAIFFKQQSQMMWKWWRRQLPIKLKSKPFHSFMAISLKWHDFKRFWERKTYRMIFIDLLRVFDILDTILLEKMKCIGFSDDTIEWFYFYLTNRAAQCLYRESSPMIYFRTFILHVIRFNKKGKQQF